MKILLRVVLLLVVFAFTLTLLVACEPMERFQIQNKTGQTLNIYISASAGDDVYPSDERVFMGSVEPAKVLKTRSVLGSLRTYLIEARDPQGNLVYSQEFRAEELDKAHWEVVIPAN
jgi:hypothetical protein